MYYCPTNRGPVCPAILHNKRLQRTSNEDTCRTEEGLQVRTTRKITNMRRKTKQEQQYRPFLKKKNQTTLSS